jgi:hypothetical protein
MGGLRITPITRPGVDNRTYRLGGTMSVRLPAGDW